MARPTQSSVVTAIYATALQPNLWPGALELAADHIGATSGMLAYQDLVGREAFLTIARLREDLNALYLRHHTHNAYSRAMARMPTGRTVFSDELAQPSVMRKTAFHSDIIAPQGIDLMVFVGHPSLTSPSTSGGVSFTLTRKQGDRRDAVRARFRRLVPHFVHAIDLALVLARRAEAARGLWTLLEILPSAALLVDRRCRIIGANARAEALLASRAGLLVDAERHLVAARSHENLALAQMLKAAVGVAIGQEATAERAALRITRPSLASALIVVAVPLPPPAFAAWEILDGGARALVQVIDPDADLGLQADLLRQAVGLTATEARVAALIAEGRSAPESAAILGVSPATVRTHLSRCFDKTGARSQVALARLLAQLGG